ncbi:hypothetical protein YC2023_083906 [Brassica napus]
MCAKDNQVPTYLDSLCVKSQLQERLSQFFNEIGYLQKGAVTVLKKACFALALGFRLHLKLARRYEVTL